MTAIFDKGFFSLFLSGRGWIPLQNSTMFTPLPLPLPEKIQAHRAPKNMGWIPDKAEI